MADGYNGGPYKPILMDGVWEAQQRNLAAGALLGLLGIGLIYFNGQLILSTVAMLPRLFLAELGDDTLDDMGKFMRQFKSEIRIAIVVSQYALMLAPTIWFVRRFHTSDVKRYVRLNRGRLHHSILAVVSTLLIIPLGNYMAGKLSSRMDLPDEISEMGVSLFVAESPLEFIFLIFVIAVTPAICEEVFFRGYVQRTLERVAGWKSVIIVGILFGLFHLQPIGLAATAIMGLLFGYFYFRSRSIIPAIMAHFANNALVVSLLYFRPVVGGVDLGATDVIPGLWVAITLPAGLAVLGLYHFVTRQKPQEVLLAVEESAAVPPDKSESTPFGNSDVIGVSSPDKEMPGDESTYTH
ncbi:MAG: CPBP family intramembrane metalloprotease [Rhodothermales bacterium]|nr:CPBP family intramembrane metalloprotease [Rhodothermales bacterium]